MPQHEKNRPAFPALYSLLYPSMVAVARAHGYALALHGSLARDMDLIAAPWAEDAVPAEELVEAICQDIGGMILGGGRRDPLSGDFVPHQDPVEKPHGRLAWALHLTGGAYIDISVMPRGSTATAPA